MLGWALVRHRLFDLRPLGRSIAFDTLGLVVGTLVSRRVHSRSETRMATIGAPSGLRTDVLRFSMGSART